MSLSGETFGDIFEYKSQAAEVYSDYLEVFLLLGVMPSFIILVGAIAVAIRSSGKLADEAGRIEG